MNRRTALSLTVGFLAGAAVLASIGSISAQQADADAVKAVIDGYHSALSALDVQKMDGLWAHDPKRRCPSGGQTQKWDDGLLPDLRNRRDGKAG